MKWKIGISILLIVAAVFFVLKTLYETGTLRSRGAEVAWGDCTALPVAGPEDFAWDAARKTLLISSDSRLDHSVPGNLYAWASPSLKNRNLKSLASSVDFDFHPHGIDLLMTGTGQDFLFAINHRSTGETIEVFEWNGSNLKYLSTIEDLQFRNLNDLAVVSEDEFFVTFDHRFRSPALKFFEDFSRAGVSGVLHCQRGEPCQEVAADLAFANGIILSPNKEEVFVSAMLQQKVFRYQWDRETRSLKPLPPISLPFSPDNLSLDPEGNLLIAGHGDLWALRKHSKEPHLPSPSSIVRWNKNTPETIETLFRSESFGGVSVAQLFGDLLIFGNIFQPLLSICERSAL